MLMHSTFIGDIYEHSGFVPIRLTEHFRLPKNLFAYHRDSLIRPVVLGQEAASVTFSIALFHMLKYLKSAQFLVITWHGIFHAITVWEDNS